MNSEISRMAFYEAECKKKDELIGALKEELAVYQKNLREKDYKLVISVYAVDLTGMLARRKFCMIGEFGGKFK